MENQKIIPLIQKPSSYKMIISDKVESKIRYVCQRIWKDEWSGTLFYTVSGNFEDGSLTVRCEDIYLMDIGSAAYTEFDMSPEVIGYMAENVELLDYQMGLIHSHNQMSTFFSSTDLNTLREEGIDRNHFVSLIVNNEGTYTAAITRKVTSNKIVKNDFSYPSFGDTLVASNEEYLTESEEIEWFYLKIEFETNRDFQNDLKSRLQEIKTNKEAKGKVKYIVKDNTVGQKQLPFDDTIKYFDKTITEEIKEYVPWDIKELDKTYKDLYKDNYVR